MLLVLVLWKSMPGILNTSLRPFPCANITYPLSVVLLNTALLHEGSPKTTSFFILLMILFLNYFKEKHSFWGIDEGRCEIYIWFITIYMLLFEFKFWINENFLHFFNWKLFNLHLKVTFLYFVYRILVAS